MLEIGNPRKIKISADTTELLRQIDESISAFNHLRPFDQETEVRIKMAFLPDRVTASLNMEGIVATRRQTLAILDAMTISENSTKTEQEILNALEADECTFEAATEKAPLTEKFVKEINYLIERKIGELPGAYRSRDIKISQAKFTPPSHLDIPSLMQSFIDLYNEGFEHALLGAAWLHNRFTYIHPFLDGNGRTGRLLQDFCLISSGLFPTGIPSSKRDDYYDALAAADDGDWNELVQIIGLRQLDIIAKASSLAKERQERKTWVKALAQRASEKKSGALYKQYLVWLHKMHEFRSCFEYTANEFNEHSDIISVNIDLFDDLSFAGWKEIISHGYGNRTWFFSVTFAVDGERISKFVFYFRRHRDSAVDIFHTRQSIVSLLLTGGHVDMKYEFNGRFQDNEISLRELLFLNEETYVTKQAAGGKLICELVEDINSIIQEFFEDNLTKKLGI